MRKNHLDLVDTIHNYGLDIQNRVIFLNSEGSTSGEENGVDYEMTTKFLKNMHILNSISSNPITINLLSMGGDISYGMTIYHTIKSSPSETTVVAYANCCSMGTCILQAGTNRLVSPDICFMIHNGSMEMNTHIVHAKSQFECFEKQNKRLMKIYAEKAETGQFYTEHKMTQDKMIKFLDKKLKDCQDWYMDAEEVVYYGFADSIL